MKIIIPMSGIGKRFIEAGYKDPKPLIQVENKLIIEHVINLFDKENDDYVFICNDLHLKTTEMRNILKSIVPNCTIYEVSVENRKGPVDAVMQIAEKEINDNDENETNTFVSSTDRALSELDRLLNISIKGHARVELKGVQDLQQIPKISEIEAKRQKAEIDMARKTESHVRNVKEDLTSKFLRPMPGSARMYPETDHPIIKVDMDRVKEMKLPELIPGRIKRYKKLGLNTELAERMADSRKNEVFDRAMIKQKLNPTLVATTLLSTEKEIKRKLKLESGRFPEEFYSRLFKLLDHAEITKESISKVMERFMTGEDFDDIVKNYKPISDVELRKIVKENYDKELPHGALIGKIMSVVAGKADGKKVAKLISELKR